jgi:hypothetical protein
VDTFATESDDTRQVFETLTGDLSTEAAEKVMQPLILHSDLALQRTEHLAFGPYAGDTGDPLLEDYIRLFAALVPREMFLRYTTGVRSMVRATLLDRPDDAVRTLETLATLVGDEDVFIDLVKAYVLRRDVRNLVLAAERLFRVHGRIVVHPALTDALRDQAPQRRMRAANESPPGMSDFLEEYWREAARDDHSWGAQLVRTLADNGGAARARSLAAEITGEEPDPQIVADVVRAVAAGTPTAERVATGIALQHFDQAVASLEFLEAAGQAAIWEPNFELAEKVVSTGGAAALPTTMLINLFLVADREDQATDVLIELLRDAEPEDYSLLVDEHKSNWSRLTARRPGLRAELHERNPVLARLLDESEGSK